MDQILSWKTSELSFHLAKDGRECFLHASSRFLHATCCAAAVCCLHLQILSFILILVVCPDTKPSSGFFLVHKVLGRASGVWSRWVQAQIGWHIWPLVNVQVLLRETLYKPQSKSSAECNKEVCRSCTICELPMALKLLHNICFLLTGKRKLVLKNECHWCSALQSQCTDGSPSEYNSFKIYELAERLMKGSHNSPV